MYKAKAIYSTVSPRMNAGHLKPKQGINHIALACKYATKGGVINIFSEDDQFGKKSWYSAKPTAIIAHRKNNDLREGK